MKFKKYNAYIKAEYQKLMKYVEKDVKGRTVCQVSGEIKIKKYLFTSIPGLWLRVCDEERPYRAQEELCHLHTGPCNQQTCLYAIESIESMDLKTNSSPPHPTLYPPVQVLRVQPRDERHGRVPHPLQQVPRVQGGAGERRDSRRDRGQVGGGQSCRT